MKKRFFLILILIFLASIAFAQELEEEYSYEKSEQYFHLINWHEYNNQTFELAARENKPIYLILSAVWCYWCHVYESPDYLYDERVYPYINENFIPVFVDADKRQGLTRQYLEGGWPSTTILTPNNKRITGFSGVRPPQNLRINLEEIVAFVNEEGFFNEQNLLDYKKVPLSTPNKIAVDSVKSSYLLYNSQLFDTEFGGFGTGQKFPQGLSLDYYLDEFEKTKKQNNLGIVLKTFENQFTIASELQTNYRLFDPIEGGFHRYGTQRDWSPPHYEKMLKDNARLLRVYSHLYEITNDETTLLVVNKTIDYIKNNLYDSKNGGFYGSQDAGEIYYPLNLFGRENFEEKPFVDKTKYTEWNSEAIIAFFKASISIKNPELKQMAIDSLDFYEKNLNQDKGAFHFYDVQNLSPTLTGQLLDNSWLLLAFVEGYEQTNDQKYLSSAEKIAKFSLNNLYDWESGGFFERNSDDLTVYERSELLLLDKPPTENGVMIFALLKLYDITKEEKYLIAGMRSFAALSSSTTSLDRGYYLVKSADFISENNFVDEFLQNQNKINQIELGEKQNFFLNKLLLEQATPTGLIIAPKQFELSNKGAIDLPQSFLIILIIAFLAGLLSFLSPCTLPVLPAYFAFAFKSDKKSITFNSIFFFLGLAITFSLLGIGAALIGSFFTENRFLLAQIGGAIIIIFGLLELTGRGFSGIKIKQTKFHGTLGSFVFGLLFALGWSACIGPILASILILASTTATLFHGGLLLFVYAIGLGLPLILVSLLFGSINENNKIWKLLRGKLLTFKIGDKSFSVHSTSLISGVLLIIIGLLMLFGVLYTLNQFVISTDIQKIIIGAENYLLEFFE